MQNQTKTQENTLILEEIFMKSSNEVKTNRFENTAEMAPCGGNCASGACKGFIDVA